MVSIRRWSLLTFSFCVSFVAVCGCSHSSVCMFCFVSRWQELILGACVEEDKLVCAVRGFRAAASEHFHFGTRTDPVYETLYPFRNNRRRTMSWSCVTKHKCFYPHNTFQAVPVLGAGRASDWVSLANRCTFNGAEWAEKKRSSWDAKSPKKSREPPLSIESQCLVPVNNTPPLLRTSPLSVRFYSHGIHAYACLWQVTCSFRSFSAIILSAFHICRNAHAQSSLSSPSYPP